MNLGSVGNEAARRPHKLYTLPHSSVSIVGQPLFTPSPFEGLAVRSDFATYILKTWARTFAQRKADCAGRPGSTGTGLFAELQTEAVLQNVGAASFTLFVKGAGFLP
jgi:hypothetical protein